MLLETSSKVRFETSKITFEILQQGTSGRRRRRGSGGGDSDREDGESRDVQGAHGERGSPPTTPPTGTSRAAFDTQPLEDGDEDPSSSSRHGKKIEH